MFRKKLVFILAAISLSIPSKAQVSTRLTENWQYLKGDLGGIWEAVRPYTKGSPESVPLWQKVTLPHSFNERDAVDPDVNYYQGPGWYKTTIAIHNPFQNGHTLLHFEGAGQKTRVYIYDQLVGEHVGGYDEWTVDITQAVEKFQKNEEFNKRYKGLVPIEIRCDNSRDLEMIPSDLSDFNIYGGLYRYLDLVYQPELYVDKIFAHTDVDANGKEGNLQVKLRLNPPVGIDSASFELRLYNPEGVLIQKSSAVRKTFYGDQQIWSTHLKKPALWSPDQPQLYHIEVLTKANGEQSIAKTDIGFRNFEFIKHGPFMLNGKRLLIRGTHRHEDQAGVGPAMSEADIKKEMKLIKDMGVNFIRLAHYQQSPIVLQQCDSLGIMVWEEIPWCRGGLGGEVYKNQARRMLTNMIEQHFNHPAVIIWGLGNENDWPNDFPEFDQQQIREFMKEQNDRAHRLDPSRKTAIRRCDFCKDIVDVYSPSIWAGWYRGLYTEYKSVTQEEFDKVDHFLHMEWGGDSHARRHSENPDQALSEVKRGNGADERAGDASLFGGSARVSKDGDWSESYICNLIDWHLKEQETMPWLTGSAAWVFKDFSTPVRPDNPIPYMNQKGVVERDLTKKEAYYVFQSYWTTKPMVHIYGHSWPVRWGDKGQQRMVKVYSNCEKAELFVNGKSYGMKIRNSQDFPAAGLRWMVNYREGDNDIKVIAYKGKEQVTDEIKQKYQTQKWSLPTNMTLELVSKNADTATVEVKLFDQQEIQCLDAKNVVEFGIAGDGKLMDDLGTSDGSRKVQMYNGRALISIQLNHGHSIVSVRSEGLPTTFIKL